MIRGLKYSFKTFLYLSILIFILDSCILDHSDHRKKRTYSNPIDFDLVGIKKRGKLIALTDNSSTSFFVYKGENLGFEYELLKAFSDHIGVKLEVIIVKDIDNIFEDLNTGTGDIAAANLTVTAERQDAIGFTNHHSLTRQVLIQRKPQKKGDSSMVKNQVELAGKKIHVREGSSFYDRLLSLSDEIGSPVEIVSVPGNISTEELIGKVANGEIDFTIADENVALLNAIYFPNLNVSVPVSFPQKIAWGCRINSPDLQLEINNWFKLESVEKLYEELYKKYFRSQKDHSGRGKGEYLSKDLGIISEYDDLIKQYSDSINWDWKLVASIICQESGFDHSAQSWAGASGLMQMIPSTAKKFGADSSATPEDNIRAGTKYLASLDNHWKGEIRDKDQRIKFILASYNVGLGHIIDARNLARKYGKSPDIWEGNVAYFVLLKSNPIYYTDEVVKCGYCRGKEPFNYVNEVILRYNHYLKDIKVSAVAPSTETMTTSAPAQP